MLNHSTEIKQQFSNSLKRGTGEAYLLMLDNSGIDFSELIIKGATKNFALDQQSEGSRANYIYRVIKKSKQKDKIISGVLAELQKKKDDYWALDQMCDLAALFYKSGYFEAKDALYRRFAKNDIEGYEFCGQDQLMEVDGLNGLLKVAETIGKSILEEGNWEDSWHVDNFQKKNKSIEVYSELKRAGKKNKYIKAYYQSILEHKWILPKRRKVVKFSYEIIKGKIEDGKFRFIITDRANDLSAEEVERLATDFLQEKDLVKKEQYLYFFKKRKFPFDYHALLKIASGKNQKNTRLVEYAAEALKFFRGKDMRQLALKKLKKSRKPYIYLNLLVNNYQSGDFKLLCEIANKSDNYDFIHSLVFGFIDIYEVNKTRECKEPLEIIYNKMNCGLHRKDIVKLLLQNNVLSKRIKQELPYDSYDEIRRLYGRQKKDGR
jgi:hypothetical protein